MAKIKPKKRQNKSYITSDSGYLLKIVMYLIIGSQWLRFVDAGLSKQIPIPVGFIVGLIFASHDHFKIDRKIEYAVLSFAMFLGFWIQTGLYVSILK